MANDQSKRETSLLADRQDISTRRPIWRRIPVGWLILPLVAVAWGAAYLIYRGVLLFLG